MSAVMPANSPIPDASPSMPSMRVTAFMQPTSQTAVSRAACATRAAMGYPAIAPICTPAEHASKSRRKPAGELLPRFETEEVVEQTGDRDSENGGEEANG